jgi:hypothetical protein
MGVYLKLSLLKLEVTPLRKYFLAQICIMRGVTFCNNFKYTPENLFVNNI